MARRSSEKRRTWPPNRWNRMTSFHRPSRIRNTSSTPFAADASVCFCLPFGKNLTFLCVLAIWPVYCLSSNRGAVAMIDLPKPVAAYFAAENAGDAGALARCFATDGVVHDEGGTVT